ncbi:MAG: tetratricopeptide repeat protein [Planctomycetota bacterium]|nr:tetratricopeptide repeat protein [Planctomycetota bacterium]
MSRWAWGGLILAVVAVVVVLLLPQDGGREPSRARFVPRASCVACHQKQYDEWVGSHHDLAMDVATAETVLADFNDTTFDHYGVTSRFFKKDGRFFVHTDGENGKMAEFEVTYVFGVEPLQQYLIDVGGGRLQTLTISWDTEKKRWFHIYDERIAHDDPLHWTGPQYNWNFMCAECHSTNLQKNYDPETNTYDTAWTEIDVSCQACHGPGSNHVAWAENGDESDDMGLEIRLKDKDQRVEVEACARCHSRRVVVDGDYEHGRPFLDHYVPLLLEERLYHSDGQILDEVYVFGSFLQTKKYRQGVRCTDCHDAHTARLKRPGNALCIQCHQSMPPPQYETVQKKEYDTPEHHFHEAGTPGAACVNCHMPAKKFMVVDPRRDHSFRVPRPDLSVTLGTPNACSDCHTDKSAQWAADALEKWYPKSDHRGPHFAETLATAREAKPSALPGLIELAQDPDAAGIVRATALTLLVRYASQSALDAVFEALQNDDPLMRTAAIRVLSALIPRNASDVILLAKVAGLEPLLEDPVRVVRVEAARALTEVPARFRTATSAFNAALDEFRKRQDAIADRPEAFLNLGVMHSNLGRADLAEASYRRAIRMDEGFAPPRFNLANLLNAQGRNDEAESQIRAILQRDPENGEAQYSLGLLLSEVERFEEAANAFGKAARLLPGRPRVLYNQGVLLQHLGMCGPAKKALKKAYRLAPRDPDIVNALALYHIYRSEWQEALSYAKRLAQLTPAAPGPPEMVKRIEAELKRGSR